MQKSPSRDWGERRYGNEKMTARRCLFACGLPEEAGPVFRWSDHSRSWIRNENCRLEIAHVMGPDSGNGKAGTSAGVGEASFGPLLLWRRHVCAWPKDRIGLAP